MTLSQPAPAAENHGRSPHRAQTSPIQALDLWTIFLLATQVYGTFTPPETYFGTLGGIKNYPITPFMLVITSLTVAMMYVRHAKQQAVLHCWPGYLYIVAAFVSALWSLDPQFSFQRVLRLLPAVALGVVYAQYYRIPHILRLMVIAFLMSAIASILISVAVPSLGIGHIGNGYESAWRGGFVHKNAAGFLYAVGVFITAFAYFRRAVSFDLAAPTLGACLLMVVMSESATPAVSMTLALGLAFGISSLRHVPAAARVMIGVLLLLVAALIAFILYFMPDIAASLIGRDLSLTGRTDIWAAAMLKIMEHPVRGMGYAYWNIENPEHLPLWLMAGHHFAYAHNSWVDLWLQTGLAGLILVAGITLSTFWRSFAMSLRQKHIDALMILALILFLMIRSVTESQFTEPGPNGVFWLIWASVLIRKVKADHA
ncbi:O-antigen ligase family protein [Sphingobium sp.]|uniref:O-antigen ligase family protein n=1 Tax=Sphingobium sp. TaxID=1912891 RepID=UPI003B3B28D0